MAIVKRAFAIIFGEHRIYVRAPSSSQKAPIKVYQYWPQREEHDLLLESGIAKLKDFRAGSNNPPATDLADRQVAAQAVETRAQRCRGPEISVWAGD